MSENVRFPDEHERLIEIMNEDQQDRESLPVIWSEEDFEPIAVRDNERAKELRLLLDKIGTPDIKNIGLDGSRAVWLVAMHAEVDLMERVLEEFESSYEQNKESVYYQGIPFLRDRIEVMRNGQQYYGTQSYINESKETILFPITQIEQVNERRAEFDLDPIEIPY